MRTGNSRHGRIVRKQTPAITRTRCCWELVQTTTSVDSDKLGLIFSRPFSWKRRPFCLACVKIYTMTQPRLSLFLPIPRHCICPVSPGLWPVCWLRKWWFGIVILVTQSFFVSATDRPTARLYYWFRSRLTECAKPFSQREVERFIKI